MFEKKISIAPYAYLAAIVLFAPSPVYAQFPDLIEVSGQYLPNTPIEDVPPAETQISSYDLNINIPLVLADKSFLILGGAYHVDSVSFANSPPEFIELRSFHSTELSLLFVQLLPNDWSLSIRLAPGLAGDFQSIDLEMLRLNTLVMANHAFSDNFILGGGLITTFSFGTLLPLPAIYVDWLPVDGLRVEMFLPAFFWTRWTLWDRVEIGLRAEFQGNEYAVRDDRIQNAYPCRGQPVDDPSTEVDERQRNADACMDHFAYSVGSAGATVGVRLFDTVWLTIFGGHTFYRRFEPKNAINDTLPDNGENLGNEYLFRASLAWRIPEP